MTYENWIDAQAAKLESAMRGAAPETGLAAWIIPARYPGWGELVAAPEMPAGALGPVWFPCNGGTTRLAAVPFSGLRALLWQACRREPICGA